MSAKLIWWGSNSGMGEVQPSLCLRYGGDGLGIPRDVVYGRHVDLAVGNVIDMVCARERTAHGYDDADQVRTLDDAGGIPDLFGGGYSEDVSRRRAEAIERGWCLRMLGLSELEAG